VVTNVFNLINYTGSYNTLAIDIVDYHLNKLHNYPIELQRVFTRLLNHYNFNKFDEDYVYNMMDKLDELLKTNDFELFLNIVDFFVKVSNHLDGIKEDVAVRLKHPLFSFIHDGYSLDCISNPDNAKFNFNNTYIILKKIEEVTKDKIYAQVFCDK